MPTPKVDFSPWNPDHMTRYALVIGIQKYGRPGFGDLKKPVEDAEAIAQILEAHGDFVEVTRLPARWHEEKQRYEVVEAPLMGTELETAIVDFFDKVGSNEALIYFSGHGTQVTKMGRKKGYLVTSECTTDSVSHAGIALEDLNSLIGEAQFSSLVVLLDCCHSGSMLEKGQITAALGAFRNADRNYFLATACRSYEKAYEGEEYSLFTAAILKALQSPGADGQVRTTRLDQVIADELRGSGQEPVVLKSGGEIRLVTYGATGKVEVGEVNQRQDTLEKLRPDYDILNAAFFAVVADKVANNQARTQILKLRAANWSMLFQKNYVERDQQGDALAQALRLSHDPGISLMLIRGEPGAGKTALLRWLAYELFSQGKRVFHKKIQSQSNWLAQLREFSEESGGEHFYVITDDLFRDDSILEELQQNEFLFPLTLIGTTRQNEDRHSALLGTDYETVCLDLAKPSSAEKERVLALPEVKEHLVAKSAAERQKLMDSPIMLVLMLQLSAGKPFDVLLWDIIKDLPNTDDQPFYQAFGVLCCFFQHGIMVPLEILQCCLPPSDYLKQSIRSGLEGLIDTLTHTYAGYEGFIPVHELIAKTVMSLGFDSDGSQDSRCRPNRKQNPPYSWNDPPLLEQYLKSILSKINADIDINQSTLRRWIAHNLRRLAVNGEVKLVNKMLRNYAPEINTIQQQNTFSVWLCWIRIYSALGWSSDTQRCIQSILLTQANLASESRSWLSLIRKLDNREQQQTAIAQTQSWLETHSADWQISTRYLALVEHVGSPDQQQTAIAQTQLWFETHLADWQNSTKYLALVERLGSPERQQIVINQIQTWIANHPDDWHVNTQYVTLLEQCGNQEQQQTAISQAQTWINKHLDDREVRRYHLKLVERYGCQVQRQNAIIQTQIWLDGHPDDEVVRIKYLDLVEQHGCREQQQDAIIQTINWLNTHSSNDEVCNQFLKIVNKNDINKKDIEIIIRHQWQWIAQQQKVNQSSWYIFLDTLQQYSFSDLYESAIELAMKQHPDDTFINCFIFEYFQDDIDDKIFQRLATFISQSHLPCEKWVNYIYAANFFGDHLKIDTAQEIHKKLTGIAKKKIKQLPDLQKTITYLCGTASKRSVFHIKARNSSQNAIPGGTYRNSYFYHQLGYFCRYAADDLSNARQYFERSLAKKNNLPASIELAEIEAKDDNYERAKTLLQEGLSLIPVTRSEKKEREKFHDRIVVLATLLGIPEAAKLDARR
jgi:uncharacterized protein YbgA (DUF1722 family)